METRKSQYNKKGMYSGYKKNNKEREALDYYSTPTEEVTHILNILNLDLNDKIILEPHCGGGHMVQGILNYSSEAKIFATDVVSRFNPFAAQQKDVQFNCGIEYDFLSDSYPLPEESIDYIIMNPPYSTIEPNVMRALGIANKGVILLGRLQFLEGQGRYENIFSDNPPTDVYVYVDRIACFRNGDLNIKPDSVQAYAWFIWDFTKENKTPNLHWIRRLDKEK